MKANTKIVYAEDDKIIARLTMIKLKTAGFDVHYLDNGNDVLNSIKTVLPSIVLLDIMMPGKDGITILKEMKQIPEVKDIPVIFLTSLSDKGSVTDGLKFGAADYVLKPYTTDNLIHRIRKQIRST